MNEAERCDRISLMHAGGCWSAMRRGAIEKRGVKTLEEAFISYEEAVDEMAEVI
jgi:hypothetical protein